jgi:hypothetical protein
MVGMHTKAPRAIYHTLRQFRNAPRRAIRVLLETRYCKYQEQGVATPSGKLEIFSMALQAIGQSPLPEFRAPRLDTTSEFPLVLTSEKTPIYCHSQHRNLPQLRRVIPDPVLEMNPATAGCTRSSRANGCRFLRREEPSKRERTPIPPSPMESWVDSTAGGNPVRISGCPATTRSGPMVQTSTS